MRKVQNFFRSTFYFCAGLCITLVFFYWIFLFGKGIYSAIQYYMTRDQFFQVSAEVVSVEAYASVYCSKDKDYRVTMSYEYGGQIYHYEYDYRQTPEEMLGDWVVLEIDPLHPEITKPELTQQILVGVLTLLLGWACLELWRCKKKSSYGYVAPLSPQTILYHLEKLNRKDIHRTLRCMMLLVFAGALIWVSESERISLFDAPVIGVGLLGIYVLFVRVVRRDRLVNDEVHLYFDTCLEKTVEDYEDSACHYLLLEKMEKVYSVSEKVYRRIRTGDEICLVYLGKNKKKPYLMCMEKR